MSSVTLDLVTPCCATNPRSGHASLREGQTVETWGVVGAAIKPYRT